MIDPKDVIARHTVEALIETADRYYRVVSDPTPLMVKPFAFLHESPEMLQNLGLLLAGLHLGKTMTVLDFGAGTCWLSRFLAQLNCQPICCDASPAALAIGRRLFAELPLLGTAVFTPRFLPFDGHRIDLPDESVDRIVSFDAFHHVPNTREVLAEFGRVLKAGGIAGFSEPGRRHSQSPQSQYQMKNHQVLENDIVLEAIAAEARPAGFTDVRVAVLSDLQLTLEQYRQVYEAADKEPVKAEIFNNTYNTLFNRTIFFLHKGPLRRDSRSHVGLAHRLSADQRVYTAAAGAPVSMTFTLENTGEAVWLHQNSEIFGLVRLASHLYDDGGDLLSVDFSRHDLPRTVAPGERVQMQIDVRLPDDRPYRLAFDLVAEGVSWFENLGSRPFDVRVVRG